MKKRILIGVAAVFYFLPLYFKAWIFFTENLLYAAMLLPLSFFITEPYKKWFRLVGGAMLVVGAAGFLWVWAV